MDNNVIVFSDDDWSRATPSRQAYLILNTLKALNKRIKAMESQLKKSLFFDKIFALIGGIIGGSLTTATYIGLKASDLIK